MKITENNINNSNTSIFGNWINNPNNYSNKFLNAEPFEHIIINL